MDTKIVPLWLIVLIVALPQLSETIYTPALPQLALGLHTSQSMAEYTLTTYLIGFAFGVLFWGILSDRIGRKLGLYRGLAIYILASIGCYFSHSIEILLVMRFLQAFGASVGSVLGQAIARDAIKAEERGHAFSIISIAMAFAPAIGPVIGGITIHYTSWSFIFILLCFVAAFIALQITLFLPETHEAIDMKQQKNKGFGRCLKHIMHDPRVLGFGFLVGGVNGTLFGYFAESPFFFMQSLQLSSAGFGALAFAICLPLALGGFISKKLHSKHHSSNQIIDYGIKTMISGAAFFVFFSTLWLNPSHPILAIALSMLCICIIMTGITMIIPNCLSQALQDYGDYAGTAASIFGFYYYLLIALMTGFMAILHDGSLRALPLFILIISIVMMIIFKLTIVRSGLKNASAMA